MADLKTLVEREMDRAGEPTFAFEDLDGLRVRRHRTKRITAAAVGLGLVVIAALVGASIYRSASANRPAVHPTPNPPAVELGIFEPVAGRIVYWSDGSLWAVDPNASSPASTLVRLGADGQFASATVPLGWSSDGTKLLFLREDPNPPDRQPPFEKLLYILHADGTETQVTPGPVRDAAISPDGSRVAFATRNVPGRISRLPEGLYVVDAQGGEPVRIAQEGTSPTFSPDGTQIAYVSSPPGLGIYGNGDPGPVWVVHADGTDAHEILADHPARIKWSPAGDRIAMYKMVGGPPYTSAIYTFAPDGSDFTMVIAGGADPQWSPDGSQIAYACFPDDSCLLAIADADGSNVRSLGVGPSGPPSLSAPWNPGTIENSAGG
jgi:dipeptidyl aminopeptidase/acylaminoacyl peptidase